jgi:predicted porin
VSWELFRHTAAGCALLVGQSALASTTLYGRVNLSIEQRDLPSGRQSVLADNASRWGIASSEAISPTVAFGMQLEQAFDASDGTSHGGFNRQAELFVTGGAFKLRMGRFGSAAYLNIADPISLHNHDTGLSGDALFSHVEPASRKIGIEWNHAGWTTQVAHWRNDAQSLSGGTSAGLSYTAGNWSLAGTTGRNGDRTQQSARVLWQWDAVDVGAYVQRDRNAMGHGERLALRLALALRIGRGDVHLNVGTASAYSEGLPAEGRAWQLTTGYNYHLSTRTKMYALVSRLRDKGHLYGNWQAMALGLRHNF